MHEEETYYRNNIIAFCKTKDPWGGFSNMCGGFPILWDDKSYRTSEALYQSFKFPNKEVIQEEIRAERSPMWGKKVAQKNALYIRRDWDKINDKVMYFCLEQKLLCNREKFGELLLRSGDTPIVEFSWKNNASARYWGTVSGQDPDHMVGHNVLGKLLMSLRTKYRSANESNDFAALKEELQAPPTWSNP